MTLAIGWEVSEPFLVDSHDVPLTFGFPTQV
jgi:hypothetical protein